MDSGGERQTQTDRRLVLDDDFTIFRTFEQHAEQAERINAIVFFSAGFVE